MSAVAAAGRGDTADLVLRRLPAAGWRALPVLFGAGIACVCLVALAASPGGAAAVLAPAVSAVGCAPLLFLAARRVSAALFDLEPAGRPWWDAVRIAVAIVTPAGLLATCTLLAAVVAVHEEAFQGVVVAGALLTGLAALVALVALPLAAARSEVGARTVLTVAFTALLRRPVPPLGAAVALATAGWACTAFPGAFVLLPGLAVLLSVAASWAVAQPAGVALPALAPRHDTRTRQGER